MVTHKVPDNIHGVFAMHSRTNEQFSEDEYNIIFEKILPVLKESLDANLKN